MSDIGDTIKNNGTGALIALLMAAGGINFMSEGAEDEESEQMTNEFRSADILQDRRHSELLEKYNALDKEVALLRQQVELQER